ncbi:hypothetical protein GCM10017688_16250 [Streptomyces ramulosus]
MTQENPDDTLPLRIPPADGAAPAKAPPAARRRHAAAKPAMWTPVLNNVVLIAVFGLYIALLTGPREVADITAGQVRLLGIGTTAGIVVQAVALIPFVRASGFRFRPRFDWRGAGLRKSLTAARWTLLLVLANLRVAP